MCYPNALVGTICLGRERRVDVTHGNEDRGENTHLTRVENALTMVEILNEIVAYMIRERSENMGEGIAKAHREQTRGARNEDAPAPSPPPHPPPLPRHRRRLCPVPPFPPFPPCCRPTVAAAAAVPHRFLQPQLVILRYSELLSSHTKSQRNHR